MTRRFFCLLFTAVAFVCQAQELKVKSFELLVDDKSAIKNGLLDNNGHICALIRIELPDSLDRIEGNVVGTLKKAEDCWQVFLTDGTRMMRIIPSNRVPLMITFADYQLKSLKGGCTYLLKIESMEKTNQQQPTAILQDEPEEEYHGSDVETFQVKGVSFMMVRVAGGTFMMGATGQQGSISNDYALPAHQVKLSTYWIGQTEVTQALWKAVMGKNPATHKGSQLPAENFSYNDCLTFIEKLNTLTGREFRLPTEAEWEFAARGGRKSKGYAFSGSDIIDEVGWYNDLSHSGGYKWATHPVGRKNPNELGLYDMSGNVAELCSDYHDDVTVSPDAVQANQKASKKGKRHISRGGSVDDMYNHCRVYDRGLGWSGSNCLVNNRCYDGLRLAVSAGL